MNRKIVRHTWNAISGVFVLLFSIWLSGPGIGEGNTPTNRWYFMLLFILWAVGFTLQFKERTRVIGFVITFIPIIYYLVLYVRAAAL
ncbi:hypothetical protein IMZ08_17670 [Bacillus luteolus]|uniref:Uncharacterized protein n=1 Tax=Litchfieldia luteola TaxID=682179 RepID=A0ABR9QN14_9BACI|nr:hypothetical protein [Cytobacillus luteolus]MBE4909867.1 hypothetical protein [Cytobacillus luteolus]MBP1942583.1 hypothetical protein [Cytobacillus luteolus]